MTKFITISFLMCVLFTGCALNQPHKQTKEWNSLFDSSDWQPINNEKTIENFNKKAM